MDSHFCKSSTPPRPKSLVSLRQALLKRLTKGQSSSQNTGKHGNPGNDCSAWLTLISITVSARGGGVHNMLRVRVCAAHMGGFWAPKSLNKG